jgi:hypothetical protein
LLEDYPMRRFVKVAGAAGIAVGIAVVLSSNLAAQGSGTRGDQNGGTILRTPWGHPDLQGLWNVGTMTPVERPASAKGRLTMTVEEARALEKQQASARAKLDEPSDGNRQAPPVGGDGTAGPYGNVGGYNYFWIDPGETLNKVDGQLRTSLVVDPPDGRVPQMLPEAMKRNNQSVQRARPTSDAGENVQTTQPGAYDDIEQRPLGERCIIGFGSTSGPPMLPTYFYNNLKQIVQTRDYVMILTEMVHDARIIPFRSTHAPPTVRKWMGDSIARWEGDTLVIETTNFNDKTRFRGSSGDHLKVTERFSRLPDNTVLYRFTIEDPTTWPRPWTGEYTWAAAKPGDQLYEYACHEGNYAMEGIMKGARLLEAEAAEASKQAR